MSTLENFVSPALTRALGWTLLHSLWQGALVAAVLAGALLLLRRQRAEVRYVAAAGALGAVVALAGLTFGLYFRAENRPEALGRPGALETTWRVDLLRGQAPTAAAGARTGGAAATMEANSLGAHSPLATAAGTAQSARSVAAEPPQTGLMPAFASSLKHSLATGLGYFDRNLPLLVVAWLLGLLAMGLRMLGGLLYVQRLRRYRVQPLGAGWQARLAALATRAGVRRPVALLESALVRVPLVVGHVRPAILLPLGAVAGLPPAYLEAILAHELAHVLRRDYLVNLLQTVAEVLFFYHPAVWFVARCVRTERENCCDDTAAALVGGDPLRLARALAALAEWGHSATAPAAPRLALAALGGRGALLHRVRRLVQRRPAPPTLAEGVLAGALVLGGLALLGSGVVLAGPLAGHLRSVGPLTGPLRPVGQPLREPTGATATANAAEDTTKRPRTAGTPGAASKDSVTTTATTTATTDAPATATAAASGPGTVVVTKDKKGRLTGLVVNGQPVDAALAKPTAADRRAGRQVTVVPLPPAPPAPNQPPSPPADPDGRSHGIKITWDTNLEQRSRRLDQKARELDQQAREMERKVSREMDEQGRTLDRKMSRKLNKAGQKLDKAAGPGRRANTGRGVHIEIDDAALDQLANNAVALGNISLNLGLEAAAQGLEEARRSLQTALSDPGLSAKKRRATEQALEELSRDRDEQRRDREEAARDREEEQRERQEQQRDQQQNERERRQELQERIRESQQELRELDRQRADQHREGDEALVRELVKDGLVKEAGNFQLKLTATGLVVNGKAQPKAVFEKYRKQYESQAGRKLGPTNALVMTRNSDSRTSATATDNGPRLPRPPSPPRPAVGGVPAPPAPPRPPSPDTETLRAELRRDGLVSAADKNFQLQLNADGLTVNGQRQSDALAAKYRKLMGHDDGKRHNVTISVQE